MRHTVWHITLPSLRDYEHGTKGAFHLSELTGQTLLVVTKISLLINTIQPILYTMHERDGFSANTLGKSLFHCQNDSSSDDLAGQF